MSKERIRPTMTENSRQDDHEKRERLIQIKHRNELALSQLDKIERYLGRGLVRAYEQNVQRMYSGTPRRDIDPTLYRYMIYVRRSVSMRVMLSNWPKPLSIRRHFSRRLTAHLPIVVWLHRDKFEHAKERGPHVGSGAEAGWTIVNISWGVVVTWGSSLWIDRHNWKHFIPAPRCGR